jgi:hypothetical protein
MRIKLPILVGTVVFAVNGNAMATQGEAIFTSFTNPSSSGAKTISSRSPKTTANKKGAETWGTEGYRIAEIYSFGQMPSETSAKSSRDLHLHLPTADLRVPGSDSNDRYQTFSDLTHERNHSYFGGSTSDGFAGGQDYRPNQDVSDRFSNHFENFNDFSSHIDDSTQYFNCSVTAVPEPDERILMFFGLVLTGFFRSLRKQKVRISS